MILLDMAGSGRDVRGYGTCSNTQSDVFCSSSTVCGKLSFVQQLRPQVASCRHDVLTSNPAEQAEFNMTLPDIGVLQSAALIGYLFGQVIVCIYIYTLPVSRFLTITMRSKGQFAMQQMLKMLIWYACRPLVCALTLP